MRAIGWKGWALLGLGVCGEAFVSGPAATRTGSSNAGAAAVSTSSTSVSASAASASAASASAAARRSRVSQRRGRRSSAVASSPPSMQQEQLGFASKIAPAEGDWSVERAKKVAAVTLIPEVSANQLSSEEVEIDEISGRRLVLEFKAFGYFKRTCQLELRKNGDCVYSKGMVTKENGAWRVEEEEGTEYLQFSCPLTEMYGESFDVPSALLFWRVPLRKGKDGSIVLQGGQIISEKNELFGLKTTFIDEGTFKARVLASDEKFPVPDTVDFSDIPVPDGLAKLKKKGGKAEQVPEPPLPGSR